VATPPLILCTLRVKQVVATEGHPYRPDPTRPRTGFIPKRRANIG